MKINLISESGGQQAIRDHTNNINDEDSSNNRGVRRQIGNRIATNAIQRGGTSVRHSGLPPLRRSPSAEGTLNQGVFDNLEGQRNPFSQKALDTAVGKSHRSDQRVDSRGFRREYDARTEAGVQRNPLTGTIARGNPGPVIGGVQHGTPAEAIQRREAGPLPRSEPGGFGAVGVSNWNKKMHQPKPDNFKRGMARSRFNAMRSGILGGQGIRKSVSQFRVPPR